MDLLEFFGYYLAHLSTIDGIIVFICLLDILALIAIRRRWHASGLGPQALRRFCNSSMELFPLLGIAGTVVGLVLTLAYIGEEPQALEHLGEVTARFAAALTTTFSGLAAVMVVMVASKLLVDDEDEP